MKLQLNPGKVRFLFVMIGLLLVANFGTMVAKFILNRGTMQGLVPLFDFDAEANIPTLFATLLLLFCGLLAALIGFSRRSQGARDGGYWLFLAVVFVFLGVDEGVKIHERLVIPLQEALGTSGALFFAWVIPYGLAALVLGLIYLRFVWRLPPRVRMLVFLAGGLYVAGALGMELIGSEYYEALNGQKNALYALITTVEETLEMVGLTVFIYALLTYVGTALGGIQLYLAPPPEVAPPNSQGELHGVHSH